MSLAYENAKFALVNKKPKGQSCGLFVASVWVIKGILSDL